VNPKGRWFFRMQEATKQPNFTPDVPAAVVEAHGSNAGDVLEAQDGSIVVGQKTIATYTYIYIYQNILYS